MPFLHYAQNIAMYVAQIDVSPLPNSKNTGDAPQQLLPTILTIVFSTVGAIALMLVVIGGVKYITASGDPQKMAQAKDTIIYSLIGLAIVLAAFSIVTLVVKGVS